MRRTSGTSTEGCSKGFQFGDDNCCKSECQKQGKVPCNPFEFKETLLYNKRAEFAKTTYDVDCPFCGQTYSVYIWSFYGSGKKCECGAKLYPGGAKKLIQRSPNDQPSSTM